MRRAKYFREPSVRVAFFREHGFRGFGGDCGSAPLEFITVGMILLVPLVYLILAMASIQAGALAVEGASRQAARLFVQAPSTAEGRAEAQTAVEFALADFGVDTDSSRITIACSPEPTDCLSRRGFVTVTVSASVPLPLAPPALSVNTALSVPLRATTTEQVSRFWSTG
jgi:hypothetical protein